MLASIEALDSDYSEQRAILHLLLDKEEEEEEA